LAAAIASLLQAPFLPDLKLLAAASTSWIWPASFARPYLSGMWGRDGMRERKARGGVDSKVKHERN